MFDFQVSTGPHDRIGVPGNDSPTPVRTVKGEREYGGTRHQPRDTPQGPLSSSREGLSSLSVSFDGFVKSRFRDPYTQFLFYHTGYPFMSIVSTFCLK